MKTLLAALLILPLGLMAQTVEDQSQATVLLNNDPTFEVSHETLELPAGLTLQEDGSVVLGVDVLKAMGNDEVQAAMRQAAEQVGQSAWYAKVFSAVWGGARVAGTAVKEQVKTTAEYATQSPWHAAKTLIVGGAGYLATQGELDEVAKDVLEAVGLKDEPSSSSQPITKDGVYASDRSKVTIRDAKSIPGSVSASGGSEILIDLHAGE